MSKIGRRVIRFFNFIFWRIKNKLTKKHPEPKAENFNGSVPDFGSGFGNYSGGYYVGSGYGNGRGYGGGSGVGSGDGYGYGAGYGDGIGYGSGSGFGYEDGSGNG